MNKICNKCKEIKHLTNFYKQVRYKDGYRNICIACFKLLKSQYQKKNVDKIIKYNKKWAENNKEQFKKINRECRRKRYQNDLLFQMSCRLRNRLNKVLKSKKWKKDNNFSKYIGCSLEELKSHIESQFKLEMSWDNRDKWHIDHIIPLASAKTEEELYKLCHFTNLQPLWAIDNIRKSNILTTI